MLNATSTTAFELLIKNNAKRISSTAKTIVRMREIMSLLFSLMFFPKNGIKISIIADDESELIEPASVDIAAASNPAIIIPEIPAGKTSIINFGKISSDLISNEP